MPVSSWNLELDLVGVDEACVFDFLAHEGGYCCFVAGCFHAGGHHLFPLLSKEPSGKGFEGSE